jgi:crossover junction endodeoxyribonuclease RusA
MPTYRLDWATPPLTENQRWSHWARKAEVVRDTRLTGKLLVRGLTAPGRIEVTLVWVVNTKARRDEDNLVPTLKALCDGIVDAGVVPDDTPLYMVKNMPRILYEKGATPHMELEVTSIR